MRGTYSIVIACALGACIGDPAADVSYQGQTLLEMKGLVCAVGNLDASATTLGIAWMALSADGVRSHVTGETQPLDARYLPADFDMPLFQVPPAGISTTMRGSDGLVPVDVGIPILFDDLDGNGAWSRDREPLLGAARGQVVLHGGATTSGTDSGLTLTQPVRPGYTLASASCANNALTGFEAVAAETRVEIWLLDGVIASPVEELAPETCFWPF